MGRGAQRQDLRTPSARMDSAGCWRSNGFFGAPNGPTSSENELQGPERQVPGPRTSDLKPSGPDLIRFLALERSWALDLSSSGPLLDGTVAPASSWGSSHCFGTVWYEMEPYRRHHRVQGAILLQSGLGNAPRHGPRTGSSRASLPSWGS